MSAEDSFSVLSHPGGHGHRLFDEYHNQTSAKVPDLDVQLVSALRAQHPQLIVTTVPEGNCPLLQFAAAGHATAELDTESEPAIRWRGVVAGGPSSTVSIAQATFFGKYHYKWANEDFIMYTVTVGLTNLQYVLKEPVRGETPSSTSSVTDSLLRTIGAWMSQSKAIYVFDQYWTRSTQLYEQVQKANWDKVILDPKMKKSLKDVSKKFFDNRDVYEDYGVPWKRGLIFYGPAGNGKTISIKALMHTLSERNPSVPTLYVKNAPYNWMIGNVFRMARQMSPCLLVLEDIDTIVTEQSRSYFFNEVDGLASNDGILMIASTNHRLTASTSSRYLQRQVIELGMLDGCADELQEERVLYCEFWKNKLKGKKSIEFPDKLCPAIADITDGFSFAYLQEAFVATLLELARSGDDNMNSGA
ncbi:ATPase AAA+ type core [Neofusicoccum parvum]|uniref:ATPase AAA+ type core n=1 Tax=Neofusicoccum parvum TaxID=310453 RepID=A0ACB5S6G3_9PEZI|nr:ATPase AAA+ type core [Neofusicoccum parvum]